MREMARRSPAGLAEYASEGRWKPFGLHRVINHYLMRAAAGRGTRRIMITVPPQHGKSTLSSQYFPAWYIGRNPNKRIILASYETSYAESWGRKVRDVLDAYGAPVFSLGVRSDSSAAGRWDVCRVNAQTGAFVKNLEGGMTATGVGGSITGRPAHLLLIDDPVKDDEEAQSEVDREKKYAWYKSVALTRVQEDGVVVLIMTRWHESDLAGKLLRDAETGEGEKWEQVRLPAIAEEPERWMDDAGHTLFERQVGAPVCPERFSLGTLEVRRRAIGDYDFARLYQQRPYPKGGGFFNVAKLRENIVRARPQWTMPVRGWDFAATKKDYSDRSAGVRLSKDANGRYFIEHCVAGKWNPDERNEKMALWAKRDHGAKIVFEQDPGQAGEDQALAITRMLVGHRVEAVKQMGRNKELRADIVAAQVNVGNVSIVDDGSWDVEGFLHELETFPNGDHDDRVDALSVAFNWLYPRPARIGPGGEAPKPRLQEDQPTLQGIPQVDWRSNWPGNGPQDDGRPPLINNFGS